MKTKFQPNCRFEDTESAMKSHLLYKNSVAICMRLTEIFEVRMRSIESTKNSNWTQTNWADFGSARMIWQRRIFQWMCYIYHFLCLSHGMTRNVKQLVTLCQSSTSQFVFYFDIICVLGRTLQFEWWKIFGSNSFQIAKSHKYQFYFDHTLLRELISSKTQFILSYFCELICMRANKERITKSIRHIANRASPSRLWSHCQRSRTKTVHISKAKGWLNQRMALISLKK